MNDILEIIEPTPSFQTKKCKLLVRAMEYALTFTPLLVAVLLLYVFDTATALIALGSSYLIVRIIRSKLRIVSIPSSQIELNYGDFAIASW